MTNAKATAKSSPQARWAARYGPWAVVTGASDGIGRAMAEALARRGLNVVLVARRAAALEELAADLEKRFRIESRALAADLSEKGSIETVAAATDDLDIGLLAACAGFGTSGLLISSALEAEINMIDVNCSAVLAASRHFGRRFADQGRGGLILMSSIVAFQGTPRAANYAATKAYVQTLAEGLATELKPRGVDVLAVAPGPVQSGFATRADMRMSGAARPRTVARGALKALGRKTTVRPGFMSVFLGTALSFLPRWGRTRVMTGVMAGMTKHQDSG